MMIFFFAYSKFVESYYFYVRSYWTLFSYLLMFELLSTHTLPGRLHLIFDNSLV